jgi:8-oxo-dGTP diphosphatase
LPLKYGFFLRFPRLFATNIIAGSLIVVYRCLEKLSPAAAKKSDKLGGHVYIVREHYNGPMPYTPILATLGYVLAPDRRRVLMIHRNRRANDPHLGKYNGLGGKLDSGEDIVSGMCREVREEAGLECHELRLRGTISWPGFGKHGEDWFGFIFLIESWSGETLAENEEGTLSWIEMEHILQLPLWEGDRHFLPLVFGEPRRQFHGVMPYRDGRPVSWSYRLV